MQTTCSQCHAAMTCGTGEKSCWCQKLPQLPVAQIDLKKSCLCAPCLRDELLKGTVMFGITNCDTVKKARAALTQQGVIYVFWDFKKFGVPSDLFDQWITQLGWEALVNKRGTTWRKLDAATQNAVVDASSAKALMLQYPSVIKRPVLSRNRQVAVGTLKD